MTPTRSTILGVTRGLARLQNPPNVPRGMIGRYGYGFPFQVSSTQAAILANIHGKLARTDDFELGSDAIVFDDPRQIIPDRAVEVSRTHRELNPNAGAMGDMVKQCPVGGFIPLGARRPDGSPHPHAGTGFVLAVGIAYELDDGDLSKPYRGAFSGTQHYAYYELQQLSFDGNSIRVIRTDRIESDQLLPGHRYLSCPLRMAIADGDDLLATAAVAGPTAADSGIVRWQRGADGWQPVSFHPVAVDFGSSEPSLVRDIDGSFLFTVRPEYTAPNRRDILVWRSRDGVTWTEIINVKNIRYQSPITINTAADGTPYIVCNHYVSALMNYAGTFMDGAGRITSREMLCLWPLNENRTGLLSPHIVSFPRYQFGPPPVYEGPEEIDPADSRPVNKGRDWTVDHSNAATVRLADGRWHNLICHRLLAQAEVQGGIPPTPHSGLCVEEVLSAGPPRAEWNFGSDA